MQFIYGLSKSGISLAKYLNKKNIIFNCWDDDLKVRQRVKKLLKNTKLVNPKLKHDRILIQIKLFFKSAHRINDTSILIIIRTPPIVGVPTLLRIWVSGPSLRIGCPDGWIFDNDFIINSPKINEKNNEVKIAAPVLIVI